MSGHTYTHIFWQCDFLHCFFYLTINEKVMTPSSVSLPPGSYWAFLLPVLPRQPFKLTSLLFDLQRQCLPVLISLVKLVWTGDIEGCFRSCNIEFRRNLREGIFSSAEKEILTGDIFYCSFTFQIEFRLLN